MEIADIIMKLVGDIEPVGETHVDGKRLENLKALTAIVDGLLERINEVSDNNEDSAEYSRKQVGKHAYNFLMHVRETYHPAGKYHV